VNAYDDWKCSKTCNYSRRSFESVKIAIEPEDSNFIYYGVNAFVICGCGIVDYSPAGQNLF